jgi:hypothetical protein
MRCKATHISLIIIFLCFGNSLWAQVLSGAVFDNDSKDPVSFVSVTNKRNRASAYSDIQGKFKIEAKFGDTLLFAHPAYIFSQKVVTNLSVNDWHYMEKRKYALDEVEILSDMAKFKKDSADKHTIYRKTLRHAEHKPGASFNNGVAVDGLFTSLAFWISGKGKKNRNFRKMLLESEYNRFTSVRYNVLLVRQQTGLNEEDAMQFIVDNPMPYDYVRAASDLEIKMWIRNNYKTWVNKPRAVDSPDIIAPQR